MLNGDAMLYYLHGKESSPKGFRACYIRERFPHVIAPELPQDVLKRRVIQEDLIKEPAILVGSSLGGMSALDFAVRNPHLVRGMVLIAPAVGFFNEEYHTPEIEAFVSSLHIPKGIPARVIAGSEDEIIPLSAIQAMVARSPGSKTIELMVYEDSHRLHHPEALEAMVEGIRLLQGQALRSPACNRE